jgi:hypothetical protein
LPPSSSSRAELVLLLVTDPTTPPIPLPPVCW